MIGNFPRHRRKSAQIKRLIMAQKAKANSSDGLMAARSGSNLGQYPDAAGRHMRLALKAQGACRSTLDALAQLRQPRPDA